MTENARKRKVAVKGGVYTIPENGEDGHLIGSKCGKCGTKFYPQRKICANCYADELEAIALSKNGKIWSYTIAQQAYPGLLLKAPFIVAYVELPEKVHIMTLITDIGFDEVKIGMEVKCFFYKIAEDAEKEVIAFAFRPVSN